MAYIRYQLGHHSIRLTVYTYGHFGPGANRAAVDRLDDATGRNLYATVDPRRETRMSQGEKEVTEIVPRVYYRQG